MFRHFERLKATARSYVYYEEPPEDPCKHQPDELRELVGCIFEDDLFGFRTRVKLVEDKPCILGVTCDENGYKIINGQVIRGQGQHDAFDRQDQEFFSDAPAECRLRLNPNGCQRLSNDL